MKKGSRTQSMMKKNNNFSLIEMLVVFAMMLILISLLQPSMRRVKESANSLQCLSNYRLIASSIFLYAEDHVKFPNNYKLKDNEGKWIYQSFSDHLAPYDGRGPLPEEIIRGWTIEKSEANRFYNSSIYLCPNERDIFPYYGKNYLPNAFQHKGTPLGMVGSGTNDQWSETPSFYPSPENTLALVESSSFLGGSYRLGQPSQIIHPNHQSGKHANGSIWSDKYEDRWHNNGWNYLFIDGHTENLRPEETSPVSKKLGYGANGMWTYDPHD